MLCSEKELGLGNDHSGIMVLPADAVPGTPAAEYFHLESDFVIEVDITPNHSDACSHWGVARDFYAWLLQNGYKTALHRPDCEAFKVDNHDIEYHSRIIAQKAMARELITFTSEIQTQAFDDTTDIAELLGEAENSLFQIAHRNVKKDFTSIDVVLQETMERIRTASQRAEGMSGLASGFRDLDNITSGCC